MAPATPTRRALLILGAAMSLAAAFPPMQADVAAWFAPFLLLLAVERTNRTAHLLAGAIAGLVSASILSLVMKLPAHLALNLIVTQPLLLGFWAALSHPRHRGRASVEQLLLPPMFWCGLEYLRAELFPFSLPHFPVGATQDHRIAQALLPIIGVYGVGMLPVAWSAAMYAMVLHLRPGRNRAALVVVVAFLPLIVLIPPAKDSPDGSGQPALLIHPGNPVSPLEAMESHLARFDSGLPLVVLPADASVVLEGAEGSRWLALLSELNRLQATLVSGLAHRPEGAISVHVPYQLQQIVVPQRRPNIIRNTSAKDQQTFPLGSGISMAPLAGETFVWQLFPRQSAQRAASVLVVSAHPSSPSASYRSHLEMLLRIRAMETALPLLAAIQGGPTISVSRRGTVLAAHDRARSGAILVRFTPPPAIKSVFTAFGWLTAPFCVVFVLFKVVFLLHEVLRQRLAKNAG